MIDDRKNNNAPGSILLSNKDGLHVIPLEVIIRLKSDKNYTIFYCTDRSPIRIAKTLKVYERILPDILFSRINKSNIININHILNWKRKGSGLIEMTDGELISISRYKKKAFLALQYSRSVDINPK